MPNDPYPNFYTSGTAGSFNYTPQMWNTGASVTPQPMVMQEYPRLTKEMLDSLRVNTFDQPIPTLGLHSREYPNLFALWQEVDAVCRVGRAA